MTNLIPSDYRTPRKYRAKLGTIPWQFVLVRGKLEVGREVTVRSYSKSDTATAGGEPFKAKVTKIDPSGMVFLSR